MEYADAMAVPRAKRNAMISTTETFGAAKASPSQSQIPRALPVKILIVILRTPSRSLETAMVLINAHVYPGLVARVAAPARPIPLQLHGRKRAALLGQDPHATLVIGGAGQKTNLVISI